MPRRRACLTCGTPDTLDTSCACERFKKLHLEPLGLSASALAAHIGVSRKAVSAILNGRAAISADMALRLSRAFKETLI